MSEQEHLQFKGIVMHELQEFYDGELRRFFGDKHVPSKRKLQAVCRFVLLRIDAQDGADPEEIRKRLAKIKEEMKGRQEPHEQTGMDVAEQPESGPKAV